MENNTESEVENQIKNNMENNYENKIAYKLEDLKYIERIESAIGRIKEISRDNINAVYREYFLENANFILSSYEIRKKIENGEFDSLSLEELKAGQEALYTSLLSENYKNSIYCPAHMEKFFGRKSGRLLSLLACEIRTVLPMIYRGRLYEYAAVLELFLEIYTLFLYDGEADAKEIENIIYRHFYDYLDESVEKSIAGAFIPDDNFIYDIIMNSDLNDIRYLFKFGDYISDEEIGSAYYLLSLTQDKIKYMADAFTDGFIRGFKIAGKDISEKKYVSIRYTFGFERLLREIIRNFEKTGIITVFQEKPYKLSDKSEVRDAGCSALDINKQYILDHKFDNVILMKKAYLDRKIELAGYAYEKLKEDIKLNAGPALIEVFGEEKFNPVYAPAAYSFTDKDIKLSLDYRQRISVLQSKYIKREETSFAIIAWPLPGIIKSSENALCNKDEITYKNIFDDIIRINTLDTDSYCRMQQILIDNLDKADFVRIKGRNKNKTDLCVNIYKIKDHRKESAFENCLADVNIPLGEVFTSPVLKGTDGILNISEVYIGGIHFKNLIIKFKDGMVTDYSCSNFDEENLNGADSQKKLIENVLLKGYKSLPMGEFAIGTNTAAYAAAKKYGIFKALPILIAEKTGPHFALGDTCYSHEEDFLTYNPDGKLIAARDNEISILRKDDISKAYFNCHTDITVPYDEIGCLCAVDKNGNETLIIENGYFVLEDLDELNDMMRNLE